MARHSYIIALALNLVLTGLCMDCEGNPQAASHTLLSTAHLATLRRNDIHRICATCSNLPVLDEQECESVDCPMLYARMRSKAEVSEAALSEQAVQAVWSPQRLKKLATAL